MLTTKKNIYMKFKRNEEDEEVEGVKIKSHKKFLIELIECFLKSLRSPTKYIWGQKCPNLSQTMQTMETNFWAKIPTFDTRSGDPIRIKSIL